MLDTVERVEQYTFTYKMCFAIDHFKGPISSRTAHRAHVLYVNCKYLICFITRIILICYIHYFK